MAKQFSTISLFLLCLLAFQEVMQSEASICSAPSRLFSGLCFSRNNCSAICEKEGFLYGLCKGLKCVCQKDCNSGGGGGGGSGGNGGDQGQGPPEQGGGSGGDGGDQGQGQPEQGGGDQPFALNRKYLN